MGARGLAKDDAPQLQVGDAGHQLHVFEQVGEIIHDERVRVVRRGKIPGANHTSENPYVFDTQMIIPNYADQIVDEDRAEAAKMHSCWVSFAKTGVPTCDGLAAWPAYTPARDALMEFGLSNGVREHFRKAQLDAVEAQKADLLGIAGR